MTTKEIIARLKRQLKAHARRKTNSLLKAHNKTVEEQRKQFWNNYNTELLEDVRRVKLNSLEH